MQHQKMTAFFSPGHGSQMLQLNTVYSFIFIRLNVCNLGMSEVRRHLISQVANLAFCFHIRALYFVTFIFTT